MINDKEFNFVSQLSHFGWGALIVFFTKGLTLPDSSAYLIMAFLWVIYSVIKEFWYDFKYESPEIRGSSVQDFLYQVGGSLFAILLIQISKLWL